MKCKMERFPHYNYFLCDKRYRSNKTPVISNTRISNSALRTLRIPETPRNFSKLPDFSAVPNSYGGYFVVLRKHTITLLEIFTKMLPDLILEKLRVQYTYK